MRLVVLALLVFLGYKVVPFYYYYYDLKSNCSQLLRNAAVLSDEELRRDLVEVAQRHGVEATPEISVYRGLVVGLRFGYTTKSTLMSLSRGEP